VGENGGCYQSLCTNSR
jgi:hypothetical protein